MTMGLTLRRTARRINRLKDVRAVIPSAYTPTARPPGCCYRPCTATAGRPRPCSGLRLAGAQSLELYCAVGDSQIMDRILKLLALALCLTLAPDCTPLVAGTLFPDSLWIGSQNSPTTVLNTDLNGNVLRTLTLASGQSAIGIAIDAPDNRLYMNRAQSGTVSIVTYDLTTLAQLSSVPFSTSLADLAWDGSSLWGASDPGPASNQPILRIDPSAGTILQTISLGVLGPFPPGYNLEGLAADGSGFWTAIQINGGGGIIRHYDYSGNPTPGESFSVFGPLVNTPVSVGWDSLDNTLYVGALDLVSHYTTTGTLLGSFAPSTTGTTFPNDYAMGVEFEGNAPEPTTLWLVGIALLTCFIAGRMRRNRFFLTRMIPFSGNRR